MSFRGGAGIFNGDLRHFPFSEWFHRFSDELQGCFLGEFQVVEEAFQNVSEGFAEGYRQYIITSDSI